MWIVIRTVLLNPAACEAGKQYLRGRKENILNIRKENKLVLITLAGTEN